MSISSDWNEYFKIEEKHLTKSALRRLKIAVIAAVPIIPVLAGFKLNSSDSHIIWNLIVLPTFLISVGAWFYTFIHPITSTLLRKNKELDEWGISHKLTAQSFGFRITFGLILNLWFISFIAWHFLPIPSFKLGLTVSDIANLMLSVMSFLWLTSAAHIAWTVRPITMEDGLQVREDKAIVTAREQKVEATIIAIVVGLILLGICAGLVAWGYMSAHHAAGH